MSYGGYGDSRQQQFYSPHICSLVEDGFDKFERPSRSSINRRSIGTSTGNEYLGPSSNQQQQYSPRYRDASSSPQPSYSEYQHYMAETEEQAHHNSPLSDVLLLALRRSRPNTRYSGESFFTIVIFMSFSGGLFRVKFLLLAIRSKRQLQRKENRNDIS